MPITLLSSAQALEGRRFIYLGPQPECGGCKLKAACLNLDEGSTYEVKKVRPKSHGCILNEDTAAVIEVEKVPTPCSVPKKSAIEGSVITHKGIQCGRMGCPEYKVCHPEGVRDGAKVSIAEACGDMECPAGHSLVAARVI